MVDFIFLLRGKSVRLFKVVDIEAARVQHVFLLASAIVEQLLVEIAATQQHTVSIAISWLIIVELEHI